MAHSALLTKQNDLYFPFFVYFCFSYSLFYFKHTHFPQENQRDPNLSCFLEKPVFDPDVPTDYPGGQIYTIGRLKNRNSDR